MLSQRNAVKSSFVCFVSWSECALYFLTRGSVAGLPLCLLETMDVKVVNRNSTKDVSETWEGLR